MEVANDKVSPPTVVKKEISSGRKKQIKEITRKFGQDVDNEMRYTKGKIVRHESGAGKNLDEPAREFKEFSGGGTLSNENLDKSEFEISFIR